MELFQAKDDYILQSGDRALWCSRKDGTMTVRPATDLLLAWNPVCLGLVEGVIGKIQLHTDLPLGLVLIRQKALVGQLPGNHKVYKITKIAVIPLSDEEPQELELELCKKHHFGIDKPEKLAQSPDESKFLMKTLSQIKSNVAVPIKKKYSPAFQVKENKEKERLERRLLDELYKIFMDSDSFYYSMTYDLTNSVQRQGDSEKTSLPLWKQVDDRFFWNKHMIQDLIDLQVPEVDFWVIPIIQGFVQVEELVVNYNETSDEERSSPETPPLEVTCVDDIHPRFTVALISRRSRHRAGMRYKRRGVDTDGHVANYVETEQLIHVHSHTLSFVQTRGSVPVFWSQAGYRYNPRPRLEKGEKETMSYFAAHFEEQLKLYKKQVIINLVDQSGREKLIGDAYLKQVLLYNNSNLTYVSFDFHEHCRGMKFENVQILTDAISDIITDMKWAWVDQAGVICKQEGIFRVNCMDCLDRTNVVQAAVARVVMEQQLKKLGVMPPEQPLPLKCYRIYQIMWANNGDTISRQYAGTAALKGDFTRTGERKLAGVMKDGVNSANRYYLNRFRDAYRQAVIDLMMGLPVTEDLYSIFSKEKEHEEKEKESQRGAQEQVSLLLQTYMQLLLPDDEKFHGGWALINCDMSLIDATNKDVDVLLLLSDKAYYIAYYDEEADKVNQYQRLNLEGLEKIEIGPEPTLFGKPKFCCMRLHYRNEETSGYFHTLRAATRNPEDDGKDTLQCIAEMLRITKQATGLDLLVVEKKLERRQSRPHEDIMGIQNKPADQAQGSSGLAQGKSFLLNKFSSLNQKVKQTKTNVNIGPFKPLGKLGNFSKPDVKVNFLKPTMHVNLWKSDSSLETSDNNPGAGNLKDIGDGHSEISDDSDSYNSDPEHPCSGSLENVDYVLPSCGIVASNPRLGSRSQSIGSVELNIPSIIRVTGCDGAQESSSQVSDDKSPGAASVAEEAILIDFGTPIDAYCHQFVQDAQTKPVEVFGEHPPAPVPPLNPEVPVLNKTPADSDKQPSSELQHQQEEAQLPRPSQLDVQSTTSSSNLLTVQKPSSAVSGGSQRSLCSQMEGSLGPSPADSNGSRVVSPFAKIKSSMVQVASLTQAGLTQGINFAVAKVQKSPEPDTVNEAQENELKAMFTQCQTRIIQI
ncbi:phosphatidylinositide phosphatase SAC2-like isoform X1 [Seriola dumerili]|uniref:phosphatidylinositide phosphatase SAC2 isoform X1 n=1 Tax=Seriola dumerili TaxID=41447 RepID=UPI000BBE70E0|nr:phosphatidylinositide phosphatase SAC2 isoform X1 [Seriola dumerili]XP_022625971.1 phosphatidylinositide phosphatase SAC2-like isoform X1 [Seriola dumerili]